MEIEKIIASKRKEAKDLSKFPVHGEIASIMKEAMCNELLEEADKLEKSLSDRRIEVETQNPKRNCDRFTSGNKEQDFKDAVKAFEKETGKVLYNCQSVYTSSGDFVKWLLSDAPTQRNEKADDVYGSRFYVLDWFEGRKVVTRSKVRAKHDEGCRVLTRNDIYKGRMEKAQCEYAHAFMCGGFPSSPDSTRPSKEEWLSEEPYEFEVDEFISEKLFQDKEQ